MISKEGGGGNGRIAQYITLGEYLGTFALQKLHPYYELYVQLCSSHKKCGLFEQQNNWLNLDSVVVYYVITVVNSDSF